MKRKSPPSSLRESVRKEFLPWKIRFVTPKRERWGSYLLEKKLCKGRFSVIYSARHHKTKEPVILKVFVRSNPPKGVLAKKSFQHEIEIHRLLESVPEGHRYFVQWKGAFYHPVLWKKRTRFQESRWNMVPVLVLEMLDGDLLDGTDQVASWWKPASSALYWIQHLLKGLGFLHDLCLAHNDIKPENLFYKNHPPTIKYGDFGLSCTDKKHCREGKIPLCFVAGTLLYLSPAYAQRYLGHVTTPITLPEAQKDDVWALYVVFWNLFFDSYPSPRLNDWIESQETLTTKKFLRKVASLTQTDLGSPRYVSSEPTLDPLVNRIFRKMGKIDSKKRWPVRKLLQLFPENLEPYA